MNKAAELAARLFFKELIDTPEGLRKLILAWNTAYNPTSYNTPLYENFSITQ